MYRDLAFEPGCYLTNDVQPDSAAGDLINRAGGGNAALHDDLDDFLRSEGRTAGTAEQAPLQGDAANSLHINAAPVVATDKRDAVTTALDAQRNSPRQRFVSRQALGGGLDSMGDRVSHHVQQRAANSRKDVGIEALIAAKRFEHDLLAERLGGIANRALKRTDNHGGRQEPKAIGRVPHLRELRVNLIDRTQEVSSETFELVS
jgi:hypothetical protein